MGLVTHTYKKLLIKRYDEEAYIKYFSHKDFEGLTKKNISFKSAQGNILRGGIYCYDNCDKNSLVIFCHGMGAGHLNYMKEIEYLCKNGFEVIAYDNTGCDFSDGDDIRGMSQSLSDLKSCLDYVLSDEEYNGKHIYIMGHSWGGYAAGNILNFCKDVEKVVVLSGFVSVEQLLKQTFPKGIRTFAKPILKYEHKMNGNYSDSCAKTAYENTNAKVLIIHSEDDPIVKFQSGAGYLKETLKGDNVQYLIVNNKKHNPNYTVDAVKYMNERFGAINAAIKKGTVKTDAEKTEFFKDVDWDRMTTQDTEVWDKIISFLK